MFLPAQLHNYLRRLLRLPHAGADDNDLRREVARLCISHRLERNMTPTELADVTGLPLQLIDNAETKQGKLGVPELMVLHDAGLLPSVITLDRDTGGIRGILRSTYRCVYTDPTLPILMSPPRMF